MVDEPESVHVPDVGMPPDPRRGRRASARRPDRELIDSDWWTDDLVAPAGIPVVDVPFVSIGGGIGSFVTVDYLRIRGVRPRRSGCSPSCATRGRATST